MKKIFKISTVLFIGVSLVVSSCKKEEVLIDGCTDITAMNYQSSATNNNGSCEFAHQIIVNTWNISSECDGSIMSNVLPETIEVLAGESQGDLMIDLGDAGIFEGSITSAGIILIPSQEVMGIPIPIPGLSPTINGDGTLDLESNCLVNLTIDLGVLGSETCVLTLTL